MPKPQNDLRVNTTIGISKATKNKLRLYALKAPNRNGNESDAQVLERLLTHYITVYPPNSDKAVPTYDTKPI